jgi:hypothetical protein
MSRYISEDKATILSTRILTLSEPPSIVNVTLTTTPIELRGSKFDRKSLYIVNDTSFLIYVGFSPSMILGVDTVTVLSGEAILFKFLNDFNLYGRVEEGTVNARIIEMI